ncbi:hypothetical protein CEXT_187381 [Caerostris extrusa]|uniref:Uncharacterized protein n=1 Tax=Caerostris extrusa TaxID=172846 RepID=A0AAV4VTC7_CAEEX|nr:hypothetical protein CEXT_187381 [Caerostris extrusa]
MNTGVPPPSTSASRGSPPLSSKSFPEISVTCSENFMQTISVNKRPMGVECNLPRLFPIFRRHFRISQPWEEGKYNTFNL